uniref:Zn(2)-C6 fungal-type domain-containing protein n=1 Tax=Rhabditophanes sp. KR3021 TaxID=114890 RepID=A0AC35TRA9_9BILA
MANILSIPAGVPNHNALHSSTIQVEVVPSHKKIFAITLSTTQPICQDLRRLYSDKAKELSSSLGIVSLVVPSDTPKQIILPQLQDIEGRSRHNSYQQCSTDPSTSTVKESPLLVNLLRQSTMPTNFQDSLKLSPYINPQSNLPPSSSFLQQQAHLHHQHQQQAQQHHQQHQHLPPQYQGLPPNPNNFQQHQQPTIPHPQQQQIYIPSSTPTHQQPPNLQSIQQPNLQQSNLQQPNLQQGQQQGQVQRNAGYGYSIDQRMPVHQQPPPHIVPPGYSHPTQQQPYSMMNPHQIQHQPNPQQQPITRQIPAQPPPQVVKENPPSKAKRKRPPTKKQLQAEAKAAALQMQMHHPTSIPSSSAPAPTQPGQYQPHLEQHPYQMQSQFQPVTPQQQEYFRMQQPRIPPQQQLRQTQPFPPQQVPFRPGMSQPSQHFESPFGTPPVNSNPNTPLWAGSGRTPVLEVHRNYIHPSTPTHPQPAYLQQQHPPQNYYHPSPSPTVKPGPLHSLPLPEDVTFGGNIGDDGLDEVDLDMIEPMRTISTNSATSSSNSNSHFMGQQGYGQQQAMAIHSPTVVGNAYYGGQQQGMYLPQQAPTPIYHQSPQNGHPHQNNGSQQHFYHNQSPQTSACSSNLGGMVGTSKTPSKQTTPKQSKAKNASETKGKKKTEPLEDPVAEMERLKRQEYQINSTINSVIDNMMREGSETPGATPTPVNNGGKNGMGPGKVSGPNNNGPQFFGPNYQGGEYYEHSMTHQVAYHPQQPPYFNGSYKKGSGHSSGSPQVMMAQPPYAAQPTPSTNLPPPPTPPAKATRKRKSKNESAGRGGKLAATSDETKLSTFT